MSETVPNQSSRPPALNWRPWLARVQNSGRWQLGLIAGAAALIALLSVTVLWSRPPPYKPLYHGLSETDAGEIIEALEQGGTPFKVDPASGRLTVPAPLVHELRLRLARQGLPRGSARGFDLLDQDLGFGVSQFMETARYQRALEGELARSIINIGSVRDARVHLALPKQSVFIRDRQPPSASVLLQLHPGRVLDQGQVAAIVHLISSSVPKLNPAQVSVVDQDGNLLTRPDGTQTGVDVNRLEYVRRLEGHYQRRVEDILTPVVGHGRVRAQVALDIDFAVAEETAEQFDPKQPPGMVRSERISEQADGRREALGVPGALSNEPPTPAEVPEQAEAAEGAGTEAESGRRQRRDLQRNYEMDKRVSYVRRTPGGVRRLSAAVVLDHRDRLGDDGEPTPLSQDELDRITALVKEAVGFNADRGDTVSVMDTSFAPSPFDENPPVWQQPWFLALIKWLVIGSVAALILLLVVRPVVRHKLAELKLTERLAGQADALREGKLVTAEGLTAAGLQGDPEGAGEDQRLQRLEQLNQRLATARALVSEDPKRAVQVVKNWLNGED